MQVRSANSSFGSAASPRNPTRYPIHNPIIIAFDRNWREIYRKPLNAIDCMAWGVRDEYENGYRGIKLNLTPTTTTTTPRIHAWATPNI